MCVSKSGFWHTSEVNFLMVAGKSATSQSNIPAWTAASVRQKGNRGGEAISCGWIVERSTQNTLEGRVRPDVLCVAGTRAGDNSEWAGWRKRPKGVLVRRVQHHRMHASNIKGAWGQLDGSAGKGTCYQDWCLELNLKNPYSRRRDLPPERFALTSTYMLRHAIVRHAQNGTW